MRIFSILMISLLFAAIPPADRPFFRDNPNQPANHSSRFSFRTAPLLPSPATEIRELPDNASKSVELVYEASIGSKVIGQFLVSRIHQTDSVVYRASSEVDTHIGFHLTQDYQLRTIFSGGQLVSSAVRHVVNDKVRADTRIWYQQGSYQIQKDKVKPLDLSPITFSVPRLFFAEPVSRREVFSETYGEYLSCEPVSKDGSGEYRLRTPDGKRTHYFYNGSVCERWEVKLLVFDVKYVLLETRMIS